MTDIKRAAVPHPAESPVTDCLKACRPLHIGPRWRQGISGIFHAGRIPGGDVQ